MTQQNESRRRFLGLTGALAATGLFGTGAATADDNAHELDDHHRYDYDDVTVFNIDLTPENVVSDEEVDSDADGEGVAILDGNRLIIGGEFRSLESPLRDVADYADENVDFGAPEDDDEEEQEDAIEDLLDPGVHIHEGDVDETTGYILALVAHLNEFDDLSARYAGSFILTQSQIVTLENEEMYQDVHTEDLEDGELRDQSTPVEKTVPLFDADLTSENAGVDASALGKATAFIDDGHLIVGGEFSGLRSELRDQNENILDPGIRIRNESGEAQYGLIADIDGNEGSGQFMGSFECDDEDQERLEAGEYFVDIVTEDNPTGVAHGQFNVR